MSTPRSRRPVRTRTARRRSWTCRTSSSDRSHAILRRSARDRTTAPNERRALRLHRQVGRGERRPYDQLNLGGAVGDRPEAVIANRELAARSRPGPGLGGLDEPGARAGRGRRRRAVGHRRDPAVDAVVTARRGVALAVLTADCTPYCWPTRPLEWPGRRTPDGRDWSPGSYRPRWRRC
ncbi:laccase domain-containing protein [Streptomyces sp. M19]